MSKNHSERSNSSPNWQGRSGLDPLDTSRVGASIDGIFLRRLFAFRLRTRNIISLFMMLLFGVAATGLMLFAIYGFVIDPPTKNLDVVGDIIFTGFFLMLSLVLLIGIALLINFAINIGIVFGFWKNDSPRQNLSYRKKEKKKLPKRRKDYK